MDERKSSKVTTALKVAALPASAYLIITGAGLNVQAEEITPTISDTPVIVEETQENKDIDMTQSDQESAPVVEIDAGITTATLSEEMMTDQTILDAMEDQKPSETEYLNDSSLDSGSEEEKEDSITEGTETGSKVETGKTETTDKSENVDTSEIDGVETSAKQPLENEQSTESSNLDAVQADEGTEAIEVAVEPETEDEEYRLQYHFSNEQGWSNDPNGMVYYNGQWHLFFQYYPDGVNHGMMSWGHAVSDDLIHWTELGISDTFNAALYENGFRWHFSGSAVWDINNTSGFFNDSDNGGLVAIWTIAGMPSGGSFSQRQAIAYSTDGIHWTEPDLGIERVYIDGDGNPTEMTEVQKDYYKNVILGDYHVARVIHNDDGSVTYVNDDPLSSNDFRDPKVFWHEDSQQWIMVVAGGPLRIYSSPDLIHWSPEAMQDEITTECPELYYLPVQGTNEYKYVLSEGGRWYQIGDFEQVDGVWTFVPEVGADGTPARYEMNYAPDAYAAQSFNDMVNHRVVMVQWMSNWSYADNTTVNGETLEGIRKVLGEEHNGQFTLFSELSLVQTPDGLRLQQKPVAEYDSIKNAVFEFKDVTLDEDTDILDDFNSQQFQMEVEFEPEKGTDEVVIEVLKNTEYETTITYNVQTQTLTVDRSNSMDPEKAPADHEQNGTWFKFLYPYSAKVPMEDGKVKLNIFVDNYSIEVYANNYTTVLTELVFPDKDATAMDIYAIGTPVKANIKFATMDSYREANTDMRDLSGTMQTVYDILSKGNKGYTNTSFAELQDTYNKALGLVFSGDANDQTVVLANSALKKALSDLMFEGTGTPNQDISADEGIGTADTGMNVTNTSVQTGQIAQTSVQSEGTVDTAVNSGVVGGLFGSLLSLFGFTMLFKRRRD